jgi:hypothetical protein
LGFPLTGESQLAFSFGETPQFIAEFFTGASGTQSPSMRWTDQALAETWAASGFNGTVTLTDTTGTITPTLATFINGVAVVELSVAVEATSDVITATVPSGPAIVSNSFNVMWVRKTYLPLITRRQQ